MYSLWAKHSKDHVQPTHSALSLKGHCRLVPSPGRQTLKELLQMPSPLPHPQPYPSQRLCIVRSQHAPRDGEKDKIGPCFLFEHISMCACYTSIN